MTSISTRIETITPTLAAEYLTHCKKNRNISVTTVSQYKKAMLEGKWQLNGDSIVFDNEGNLINGSHRLMACTKANVPFMTFVVRGIEPEAFATYDCGRHRTAGQLIGLEGASNSNTIAAGIGLYSRLRDGKTIGDNGQKKMISNSDVMGIFQSDVNGFIQVAKLAKLINGRAAIVSPSMLFAIIYYLWHDKGYEWRCISNFFEAIVSYKTAYDETLEALRTRLLRLKLEGRKNRTAETYNVIAKGWNAYINGKRVKVFSWTNRLKWITLQ